MRVSRLALATAALALMAGCGDPSGTQSLAPATTTAPQATVSPSTSAAGATETASAASASTSPSPAPDRTSSPAPTRSVAPGMTVVTDGDSGRTVHLRPHERLEVRLSQDSYDPPSTSAALVLARRTSTGGYPGSGPVLAGFEALTAGQADVSTSSDYACFHSSPRCMRPSRLWVVHVIVG